MFAMSDDRNWRDLPASDPERKKKPKPPFYAPAHERVTEPGPEAVGVWYCLTVAPGQEDTVQAHLAGRGFGSYNPKRRVKVADNGRVELCHPAPELAGYILACVWHGQDVHRMRRCPGVTGIVSTAEGKPIALSDDDVGRFLKAEAYNDALALHHGVIQMRAGERKPKRRRRPRRSKRAREQKA